MDKIAVLIPCYNEAQTIEKVVTDARREMLSVVCSGKLMPNVI